jgi:hypothetical protein
MRSYLLLSDYSRSTSFCCATQLNGIQPCKPWRVNHSSRFELPPFPSQYVLRLPEAEALKVPTFSLCAMPHTGQHKGRQPRHPPSRLKTQGKRVQRPKCRYGSSQGRSPRSTILSERCRQPVRAQNSRKRSRPLPLQLQAPLLPTEAPLAKGKGRKEGKVKISERRLDLLKSEGVSGDRRGFRLNAGRRWR